MTTLIRLALRNLFRQKRRTLVSLAATATGVAGLLFYLSIMNGMMSETVRSALGLRLGHVLLEESTKKEELPFALSQDELNRIAATPGILGTSGRIIREALVTSPDVTVSGGAKGVRLYGVDPDREAAVSDVVAFLKDPSSEGEWLPEVFDPADPQIVIGRELADRLHVTLGDPVILTIVQTVEEEKDGDSKNSGDSRMALRVTGIFRSNDTTFEKNFAYVHRDLIYDTIHSIERPMIQTLAIKTPTGQEDRVREALQAMLHGNHPELQVRTWKQKDPMLASSVDTFEAFNYIFLVIIFSASAIVIVSTLLMVVQERFREFGVLKAIGASPLYVGSMIVLEGIFIGGIGSLAGLLFTAPIILILYWSGLNLGSFSEGLMSLGIPSMLHPFLYGKDILLAFVSMALFTALGSVYPAVRAARIKILDSIHFH